MSTLVAERMKERGLTDAALADRVECDRSMVNRIKFGKVTPSLPLAVKLATELDIPVASLLPPKEAA